jgi:hypothetical protein
MSNDEDLRSLLEETAQEISRLADNPRTWLSWLVFLLARLEEQATDQDPAKGILREHAICPAG